MRRTACPKCHCKAYTKQGFEKTKYKENSDFIYKERRQCKYCGTRYTVEPKVRNNKPCPFCGNTDTRKEGFSKSGIRKYYCKSCGKHFQETYLDGGNKPPRISRHNRQMVVRYHDGGFSNKFIAKLLKVGETSVKRVLDKHNKLSEIKQEINNLRLTKVEGQLYTLLRTNNIISITKLQKLTNTNDNQLRVHISHLRNKLIQERPDIKLVNSYNKGYSLSS